MLHGVVYYPLIPDQEDLAMMQNLNRMYNRLTNVVDMSLQVIETNADTINTLSLVGNKTAKVFETEADIKLAQRIADFEKQFPKSEQ